MAQQKHSTNLASEFYVLSTLYRLGLESHLTLGNKKEVDIVIVREPGNTITVDVKAVAGSVDWLVGNPSGPPRDNHFVVLLTYDGHFEDITTTPRAWVLPHAEFLSLVKSAKPPSKMRYVSRSQVRQLTERESAWRLLSQFEDA